MQLASRPYANSKKPRVKAKLERTQEVPKMGAAVRTLRASLLRDKVPLLEIFEFSLERQLYMHNPPTRPDLSDELRYGGRKKGERRMFSYVPVLLNSGQSRASAS